MLRIVNGNWHPSVTAWCTIQFSLFQTFPFYCNFRKKIIRFFPPLLLCITFNKSGAWLKVWQVITEKCFLYLIFNEQFHFSWSSRFLLERNCFHPKNIVGNAGLYYWEFAVISS